MGRNIKHVLILALVVFASQFVLPWYVLVVLSFLYGILFARNWRRAFFVSFTVVFLVWAFYPFLISLQDEFRVAGVIGEVFGGLPGIAIVITNGLVFGLLGGLAGVCGWSFNSLRSLKMTKGE